MINLLVDGVFFQLNNTGIARVWHSVLKILAADGRFRIFLLDRGSVPEIEGVEYIPFPSFNVAHCPADSQLIQDVCHFYKIDVFTSSYYTTPIKTPMLLMVYDMIPELFDFDMSERIWMEKKTAICYAQRYLCISENTRRDLLAIYPEILSTNVSMAHCGVDTSVFYQREPAAINSFRNKYGLKKPYVLFVGSRLQHNGYKNGDLFFNSMSKIDNAPFDVFCVGGEPQIEPAVLNKLPSGVRCQRVELTDDELAIAYGGALALIYPSLYEGFGMPVIEAMASGCPVITTNHGSLAEAAGNAALLIGGDSIDEMSAALVKVQDSNYCQSLRLEGLAHSCKFRWQNMANVFGAELEVLVEESKAGIYDDFFSRWERLRQIQANVDYRW